jgi:hypothetical protein
LGHANIEEKLDALAHQLLGNGQPSVVADLQGEDKELSKRIDECDYREHWHRNPNATKQVGFLARVAAGDPIPPLFLTQTLERSPGIPLKL